jgi:hypothetical protein
MTLRTKYGSAKDAVIAVADPTSTTLKDLAARVATLEGGRDAETTRAA